MTLAGLRPGEKLFEEKLMAEEGLKKTKNDLIHIGCPIPFDIEEFLEQLDELMEAAYLYWQAIYMIPGWTHNIINLSETDDLVTVMTCNEIFDPGHPDTFFEPI